MEEERKREEPRKMYSTIKSAKTSKQTKNEVKIVK